MRIDARETIAGYPMLQIRSFFRHHRHYGLTRFAIAEFLECSEPTAADLLAEFDRRGWIVRAPEGDSLAEQIHGENVEVWDCTRAGRALAIASAGKPLTRKKCDELIRGFVDRCRIVRDGPDYIVRVKRAMVFGSYAAGAERPSDVDVYVELEKKFETEDAERMRVWNRHCATAPGHIRRDIVRRSDWPWDKVLRFLKNRSTGISLTTLDSWVADELGTLTVYVHSDSAPDRIRLFDPLSNAGDA